MVSAAGGARQKLDERLDNVGKNLILIRAGSRTAATAPSPTSSRSPTKKPACCASSSRPGTTGVAEVQATMRLVATRTRNCITMVVGTSPDMQKVRSWVVRAWPISHRRGRQEAGRRLRPRPDGAREALSRHAQPGRPDHPRRPAAVARHRRPRRPRAAPRSAAIRTTRSSCRSTRCSASSSAMKA